MLIIITQAQMVEKLGSAAAERFAELYEEFLPRVYRFVAYRINDVATAEDLTSMVFEKALTHFSQFDQKKAQFSTWIFTIARNTLTDYYRSHQKTATVTLEDPAAASLAGPSPEDESEKEDDVRWLKHSLKLLSEQEQEIISFKFGAEMTNRQIASHLDLSESNVAVIIYRAVRKLRDAYRGMSHA